MSTIQVPFEQIFVKPGFNHRKVSEEDVDNLYQNIYRHGLLSNLICVKVLEEAEDGIPEPRYQVVDGETRHRALVRLEGDEPDRFEELFESGMCEITLVDGEIDDLRDMSVISNMYRNAVEPHEVYAEILRRINAGQDQYEVAEVMNVQQPRVAEFVSFQKVCDAGHDLWRKKVLSIADMVKLASLDEEAQEAWLESLTSGIEAAEGDAKAAKGAKAQARKALKATVEEKGGKREYANAGKPTRQSLAALVPVIQTRALDPESSAEEQAFYNAMAAAFKVVNGELDFNKVSFEKSYVTKKDAAEAQKTLAELEAKAAAKAEKAERKAQKAKEKAAKEKAAAKATAKAPKATKAPKAEKAAKPAKKGAAKKKLTPKKAPKKAAKKAPKKVAKKAPKKAKKTAASA